MDGLIAAAFPHHTSRAGDPLLHTHVLVANLAHTCDDDTWRTLESRRLFLHAKTAGFLYQAHLRHELSARLGLGWEPVINGHSDINGIPRQFGRQPDGGPERAAWRDAVKAVEHYRVCWSITDPQRPLGDQPTDPVMREDRQRAVRRLLDAIPHRQPERSLDDERALHRGKGLGIGLTAAKA